MAMPVSSTADSLAASLAARTDLDQYGSCKRALFALELVTEGIEDIHTIAKGDARTDGPDDKSVDILYVDRHQRVAYLIQCYEALSKQGLSVKKVATLHQAAGWVFGRDGNAPSSPIRKAVEEIRDALDNGQLDEIRIWFVHNRPSEKNVDTELKQVAETTKGLLHANWPLQDGERHVVRAQQISLELLGKWYEDSKSPILASDKLTVTVPGCYQTSGSGWRAVATVVSAAWIKERLWRDDPEDLFSANIRSYLGHDKRQHRINSDIRHTAEQEPERFWVYNNGITVLVHSFEVVQRPDGSAEITFTGMSIVNGAQTSGAIKSAGGTGLANAQVPIRFIEVENEDHALVSSIIQYNNRQNATEPSDFRSNDRHQRRLIEEFKALSIQYDGARRGSVTPNVGQPLGRLVRASNAGRALAAFHGQPGLAHLDYPKIWGVDRVYQRFFNDHTTALHVLFVTSLIDAVEQARAAARGKAAQLRTTREREIAEYFDQRGATWLVAAGIGRAAEEIAQCRIDDPFRLAFTPATAYDAALEAWVPVVESVLSYAPRALGQVYAVRGGLGDADVVGECTGKFRNDVAATRQGNVSCAEFAKLLALG